MQVICWPIEMHTLLNAGFRVGSRSFDVNQKHPMPVR